MWEEAFEWFERAERLHRQFFTPAARQAAACPVWQAPVDILETETELWVLVAMPGVEPERLEVALQDGQVLVTGLRPMPGRGRPMQIRRLEIPFGRFERRIELPVGRFELAHRELLNGCLVLSLRKVP
jgi:HSP20 family molecular chaperone IbpA